MSDGEQLLLILSLIYLSGCLLWIDRRTILFASGLGREWKSVVADYRWGNSSGRVFLLNPFPPLGFMVISRLLPVSLSPTNLVAYNVQTIGNSGRPSQSRRIVQIAPHTKFSRRSSELVVDGTPFCDIGDVETAHKLVVLLNKVKGRDEAAREQAISGFWAERLDIRKTEKQIRAVLAATRPVRLVCSLAFFLFFAAVPLTSFWFGVDFSVVVGAVTMLLSALLICSLYLSCHWWHYPTFRRGLGGDLVKMMLCPPTALRACDLIMEKLSVRLDVLPVAALLLHGADREAFLEKYLENLESADVPDDLPDAIRETCLWQNRTILRIGVAAIGGLKRFVHPADCAPASRFEVNQPRKENEDGR